MTIFRSVVAFVILWLGCLSCDRALSQWPQYRGAGGDGKSSDAIGNLDWSSGPNVVWKKPTELGFSSFSISAGRAFTLVIQKDSAGLESQTCVALDADTGQQLWAYAMNPHNYGAGGGGAGAPGNRGGDGPRSTPTVDGDYVYVYDAQMLLVCLNVSDGSLVWKRNILKEFAGRNITWANATSPVIDGQRLFVGGGGPGQSLLAFDKTSGELIWKKGDEKFTHATPIITQLQGKKQLIFFMQSGLIAVNPDDGNVYWRTDYPYRTSTAASPVVDGSNVYCSAGYGVGGGLFNVDSQMTVTPVWRKPNRLMNHWSTPVIHKGHIYGIFQFKKYGSAPLQCVDLATGEIKWKQKGFGQGNCILVGEKLVVLSDAGEVAIVAANPDGYNELARAKVLKGKCWSTPAYADGKLYVRSTQEGACINLN